jgi:hypothetical protein
VNSYKSVRFLLLGLLLVMGLVLSTHPRGAGVVAGGNHCDGTDPGPPISNPRPHVTGAVTDGNNDEAIEGATMKLYRCSSGSAVFVESDTTDSDGAYFFEDLTPGYYYYVEAIMTGPLTGMQPASGTSNPSELVGLGDSVSDLDFTFE